MKFFFSNNETLTGVRRLYRDKIYVRVKAHANLTANTPYAVTHDTTGVVSAALPNANARVLVGVPESAISSGSYGWLQIQGPVTDLVVPSGNYTAGHALKVQGGAVASTGGNASTADNEFAVIVTGGTGVTEVDVILKGRECSCSV